MTNKFHLITLMIASPIVMGLGNNNSSLKYCVGIIYLDKEDKEEIVDLKIGRKNREITVYRKPQKESNTLEDYKQYEIEFNLDQISKIKNLKKITTIDDEEYVNIAITSKKNQKVINCLIPKREKITGKSKDTGWKISYNFDKIDKLIVQKCFIKDDDNDEIEEDEK